jgi:CheY-like chemotaxis protein
MMPNANDPPENRSVRRRQAPTHVSQLQGWKVLIVDDQVDNLGVAEATLIFSGATVLTAGNGLQGMQIIEQQSDIRLILLDLSMPEMDGWEMFKKLRQNPATATIPVIALTAHAMDGDYERVMQAGFNGYIPKPFSVATLVINILDILKNPEKEEKNP